QARRLRDPARLRRRPPPGGPGRLGRVIGDHAQPAADRTARRGSSGLRALRATRALGGGAGGAGAPRPGAPGERGVDPVVGDRPAGDRARASTGGASGGGADAREALALRALRPGVGAVPHPSAHRDGVPVSGVAVRFDCPGCGPTLARGFRVLGQGLWLRCARCDREHAAAAPWQPTEAPAAAPARAVPPPQRASAPTPARAAPPRPPGAPHTAQPVGPHPLSTRPSSDAALPAPSRDLTHAASPSAEGPARITASEPRPASAPQPSAPRPAAPRPGLEILQGGGGRSERRPHPPDAAAALQLPPAPPGICPSCLRERAAIEARCAGCGLDFLKADPAAFAPSARLSRAWAALTERWEEAPAHARFLQGAQIGRAHV